MVETLEEQKTSANLEGTVMCTADSHCKAIVPVSQVVYAGGKAYCPDCRRFYLQED